MKRVVCLVCMLFHFVRSMDPSLNPSLNDDVLGLTRFKTSIHDPKNKLMDWSLKSVTPCFWIGIKCDHVSNRVHELVLDDLSLYGSIGPGLEKLKYLKKLSLAGNNFTRLSLNFTLLVNLQYIDLSNNALFGKIPYGIFQQCRYLKSVYLAKNRFSDQIPNSLTSCVSLEEINFTSNQLSGVLPSEIWHLSKLVLLDLSDNFLTGEIPIGFSSLNNLETLNLKNNHFSGMLPDDIRYCSSLRYLDVSKNSINGKLPDTLSSLSYCSYLNVHGNLISGFIPNWIGEMKRLDTLDFSVNNFSGQVPNSLGILKSLRILNLSGNRLVGNLPEPMSNWVSLSSLDFSKNLFTGNIPESIGDLKALNILDMSKNQLNDTFPAAIGSCYSLTSLILSQNRLTGKIPVSISNLTNLRNVDLSFNNLTGTLPKQLGNLPHLLSFNISHNNLQGQLPVGIFFNHILPSSVANNLNICGSVVNKPCNTDHLKPIVINPFMPSSSTSLPSSISSLPHKKNLSVSALIAIGAAAVIIIGVIIITVLNIRVGPAASHHASELAVTLSRSDDLSGSSMSDTESSKLVMFSGNLDFTARPHALLNKDCELGRGGFGSVYQTVLDNDFPVAIKKLTVSSLVKSHQEFKSHVTKLGTVRHANAVELKGYYWTPSLQLLIYEFVPCGSLYKHLHSSHWKLLSWDERFNIIIGVAKGLDYLHRANIIHYNVKSSNVLIDGSGKPKVGDFGLARLLPVLDHYVLSNKIQSALGYMAPEFGCPRVKITEKCDVYGFDWTWSGC